MTTPSDGTPHVAPTRDRLIQPARRRPSHQRATDSTSQSGHRPEEHPVAEPGVILNWLARRQRLLQVLAA